MKPLSLKLRGAIGIQDGLGLDEVSIDFTRYEQGLIAIVGPNGSAKTTILDNCHPYLQLASREGALSNHFYLRDSYRDFTFEMGGAVYRSHILIDARTGKSEAYLYRNNEPLSDGKVNTYKAEIEKLLGSPDLFFRSIFAAQNAQSITALTAGERKELFLELLGLGRYELYSEYCKTRSDELEREIAGLHGRLDAMQGDIGKRQVVEQELLKYQQELAAIQEELRNLDAQISAGEKGIAENERRIAADQEKRVQAHDIRNELQALMGKRWKAKHNAEVEEENLRKQEKAIAAEIERKENIVGHKTEIEGAVARLQGFRSEEKAMGERRQELVAVEMEEQKTHHEYQSALQAYESNLRMVESRIEETKRQSSLVDQVPCRDIAGLPEQCKLLSSAIGARNRLNELENEKGSLSKPTNGFDGGYTERKKSIGYDAPSHEKVRKEIADLESKQWEALRDELLVAESVLSEKRQLLESVRKQVVSLTEKLEAELKDLAGQISVKEEKCKAIENSMLGQSFLEEHEGMKSALAELKREQKSMADSKARIIGDIAFREEMLKRLESLAGEVVALEQTIGSQVQKLEHWRILQRACSKDGIPALELDAAGPEVSRIANELLASTFGTRFQISFETTRMSKDGKKQIETFDIRVYGEEGEKKIEDLSGGQRVWIETALQEAIAIYLSEKSGREYLTSYADERDGALDPENKQHFLDMLRESFKLGRRHFTFVISQTPEIYEQIQQRLHLVPEKSAIEFVS